MFLSLNISNTKIFRIVWNNYLVRVIVVVQTNLTADEYNLTLATYLVMGYFELTFMVP